MPKIVNKIVNIVGARPQFIKASLICKGLRESNIEDVLVHTGQHYDFNMSDIFFQELSLAQPDYHLGIGSGTHGEQTGKMLMEIERVLFREKPDYVLVYGDTNTTLAGALASSKLHIPVAHIESGLRSYNKMMPEEINRIVADHTSSILFCPSETAVRNLQKEGFSSNIVNHGSLIDNAYRLLSTIYWPLVVNVGDVMFDLAIEVKNRVAEKEVLERYGLEPKNFILVTIHRADNTENKDNLRNIWDALIEIVKKGITVFFPVHPRTKKVLNELNMLNKSIPEGLHINEPVSYKEMIILESNARIVITDSGGVQKESYFFKTPCIVPRKETEWVELLENDWAILAGADKDRIIDAALNSYYNNKIRDWKTFYGDGKAAERITNTLISSLKR
ncbi:MAG TPA: UDP-N-acetylglucosamine 2-epimerase (non-hydrolyzing) [Deltaproteobacteria bacterium]|nr:UDP-N-acetylglucosamine 2-epimerase (non-hydrolyzing) [Deltaproteobacteria bacterium]